MGKMHDALKNRDLKSLFECIEAGGDIHEKLEGALGPFSASPFMRALSGNVYSGKEEDAGEDFYCKQFTNVEAMRIFLTHPMTRDKIDLNKRYNDGSTIIFYCSSIDMINLLYSFGADVNIKDDLGYTPLYRTLFDNDKIISKHLIQLNANYKYVVRKLHEEIEAAKDSLNKDKAKELSSALNNLKEILYELKGHHYYNSSEIEFDTVKWFSKHLENTESPVTKEFISGIRCEIVVPKTGTIH